MSNPEKNRLEKLNFNLNRSRKELIKSGKIFLERLIGISIVVLSSFQTAKA